MLPPLIDRPLRNQSLGEFEEQHTPSLEACFLWAPYGVGINVAEPTVRPVVPWNRLLYSTRETVTDAVPIELVSSHYRVRLFCVMNHVTWRSELRKAEKQSDYEVICGKHCLAFQKVGFKLFHAEQIDGDVKCDSRSHKSDGRSSSFWSW